MFLLRSTEGLRSAGASPHGQRTVGWEFVLALQTRGPAVGERPTASQRAVFMCELPSGLLSDILHERVSKFP